MVVLDVYRLNNVGIGAFLETKIKGVKIKAVMSSTFVGWEYYSSVNLEGRILLIWKAHLEIILGDFNAVFSPNDRLGGRPITMKEMEDARQWLDLGLVDEMKVMGSFYTWSNNQEGGTRIFSKLDRVFANEAWLDSFPLVAVVSQWEVISDHCFILLKHLPTLRMG
ncbi:uncharacterized protein LOC133784703 [Humulus lupulus]|uniref:uncharacterized protein LOC133784703 n=1 Tax=Humulus lupulus TaxID=3486 RepID=UPI002B40FE89|nr:uncharacterized protein LOC133784703 [Humulus lupulus]